MANATMNRLMCFTRTRLAAIAPTATDSKSKVVFAETAPARPSANPEAATRALLSGALTRMASDASQKTVHRSSVRNSVDHSKYGGISDAATALQAAARG